MSVPEVMAEWKEGTSADVIAAKNKASELKKRRGRPKVAKTSINKKVVVVDPMAAILKEAAASKPDKTPEQLQMEELQRQQNVLMAKMEATQASVLVPVQNEVENDVENEEDDDGISLEEFNYE